MQRITSLAATIALGASGIASAEDIYIATFTGTFTVVNFDTVDPGIFANLGPGDTYAMTITTKTTPRIVNTARIFDALSLSVTINDGVAPIAISPGEPGSLAIDFVPDSYYALSLTYGIDSAPFEDSARLGLADQDGDPVRETHDLPLSLDLSAFADRNFMVFGSIGSPVANLFPRAYATVDGFSAQIIPAPAVLLPVSFVCAFTRRRPSH